MGAGVMLVAVAGDDDNYANAKKEIVEFSSTVRRELPGAWGVEVAPLEPRDGAPRAAVKISQQGFLVDVFIVAAKPRGGELAAPFFTRFDRTESYPLFVIGVDFAADDDGGGREVTRAA